MKRTISMRMTAVGLAALLATSGLGLASCGGSGDSGGSAAGGAMSAEAKKEEARHWLMSAQTFHYPSSKGETYWVGDDPKTLDTNYPVDYRTTYERDEHGNVLKQTKIMKYRDDELYTERYQDVLDDELDFGNVERGEDVTEYTYDEGGWPLSKKVTSTPSHGEDRSPKTTECNYKYERDDTGRVVKAASSDDSEGSVEIAYDGEGNVVSIKRAYTERNWESDDEDAKLSYVEETSYSADGTCTAATSTVTDGSGKVVRTVKDTYDDQGTIMKSVTTRPQDKGDDLVETKEYKNEYDGDDHLVKQTVNVKGDGTSTTDDYRNGETYVITCMPDGSVKEAKQEWENGAQKLGEATTYDGPYEVSEYTYDDEGNRTAGTTKSYNGNVTKSEKTYDEHGLTVDQKETTYNKEGGELIKQFVYHDDYERVDELSERLKNDKVLLPW